MKAEQKPDYEKERQTFINSYVNNRKGMNKSDSLGDLFDRYVLPLGGRIKELEENYEGMTAYCKHLTEINVFNMVFDGADSNWKKQHKVEEGENFIDYYMRYHACKLDELKEENTKLKESASQFQARILELENRNTELEKAIKYHKQLSQSYRGYADGNL